MSEKKDVLVLAIESSCDETAAAVVKNGREVLSNIISSQIDLHTLYGGVVPEIASRKHIEKINQVIEAALREAGITPVSYTHLDVYKRQLWTVKKSISCSRIWDTSRMAWLRSPARPGKLLRECIRDGQTAKN